MKEIKYIGFYDVPNSKNKRVSALSATNKMDYICNAIMKSGGAVHLVSPSWINDTFKNIKFVKKETVTLSENKKLTTVFSFGTSNKITRIIKIIFSLLWLFFWLVKHVKKNEKILLYHSPWLALPVLLAKKIKRFKLILEVEEIYGDVNSIHPYFDRLEQIIFTKADSFLLSTELLLSKLNIKKEHVIIYGTYDVPETVAFPPQDGKIYLLYAGIIDSEKAGAFNAIECAPYLGEKYIMKVIGFGEVEKLKARIEELNKISDCKILFEGVKTGKEYFEFCQSCHVGLSTQKMQGSYLDTSFPSKILSYMSLGLRVVSGNVPCVVTSQINPQMYYYKEDSPKAIAAAISSIDWEDPNDTKLKINELDLQFINNIKKLIKNE